MRDLISLIESHSGIPDFSTFITPELISRLLTTREWTGHGTGLDEWWEDGAGDYMSEEEYAEAPDSLGDALSENPELVRKTLTNFLHARVNWIKKTMAGEYGSKAITPNTVIERIIMVDDDYIRRLESARDTTIELGVFWGASGAVEPWGAGRDDIENKPHGLVFTTEIRHTVVDWKETFLSRADYMNGDEEEEIQLVKGSPIRYISNIRITRHGDDHIEEMVIKVDPSVKWVA